MKKTEFYNQYIVPFVVIGDKPFNRQLWNDTLDALLKDGTLPKRANNWVYPSNKYFV